VAPGAIGSVLAFAAFYVAHARGLHFAGVQRRDFPLYSGVVAVGLALLAILFASSSIDFWTVMRFAGSRGIAAPISAWQDHVFSRALPFYLFDLPFYWNLLGFLLGVAIISALLFWITARGWQLFERVRYRIVGGSQPRVITLAEYLRLPGATRAPFVRILAVILLLGFAAWMYLGNFELLFKTHAFMTGADYVDEKVTIPLRWLVIVSALLAVPLVWLSRFRPAVLLVVGCYVLQMAVPAAVRTVYVRPNEISIERPYIERHIEATTAAFGLNRNAKESAFTPSGQGVVDPVQDATLLANVRLWDLRAYDATITQIQALRPYYAFPDTDVDRYVLDHHIK